MPHPGGRPSQAGQQPVTLRVGPAAASPDPLADSDPPPPPPLRAESLASPISSRRIIHHWQMANYVQPSKMTRTGPTNPPRCRRLFPARG